MTSVEILKSHGLRNTPIRREVIQFLMNRGSAASHQDIESALSSADRVTLYRTLHSLEESGIVHQVPDDDAVKKYALCHSNCNVKAHVDNHVHFKCTDCGKTVCLDEVVIPSVQVAEGFSVIKTDVLVQGKCPDC